MAVDELVLETNGDGHRFDIVVDDDDDDVEDERYRELTSRDFGRRLPRALSLSEGKSGGLVEFWFVVLGLFIVVDTAATIAY